MNTTEKYIAEQKRYIDEAMKLKEIMINNDIPMPDEDMPSGSIH